MYWIFGLQKVPLKVFFTSLEIRLDRFVCLEHVDRLGETHLASKRFFEGKPREMRAYLKRFFLGIGLAALAV